MLKHGNARNNRALIHSIAPAIVIHIYDMLLDKDNELASIAQELERNGPGDEEGINQPLCGRLVLSKRVREGSVQHFSPL